MEGDATAFGEFPHALCYSCPRGRHTGTTAKHSQPPTRRIRDTSYWTFDNRQVEGGVMTLPALGDTQAHIAYQGSLTSSCGATSLFTSRLPARPAAIAVASQARSDLRPSKPHVGWQQGEGEGVNQPRWHWLDSEKTIAVVVSGGVNPDDTDLMLITALCQIPLTRSP